MSQHTWCLELLQNWEASIAMYTIRKPWKEWMKEIGLFGWEGKVVFIILFCYQVEDFLNLELIKKILKNTFPSYFPSTIPKNNGRRIVLSTRDGVHTLDFPFPQHSNQFPSPTNSSRTKHCKLGWIQWLWFHQNCLPSQSPFPLLTYSYNKITWFHQELSQPRSPYLCILSTWS